MHICHVTSSFKGGAATATRHMAKHQIGAGHRVTLVHPTDPDRCEAVSHYLPPRVTTVAWSIRREIGPLEDLRALHQLLSIVRGLAPDILHLHCSKAGFLGRVVARRLAIPSVYSPRGVAFLRRDVSRLTRYAYRRLEQIAASFGGTVVACSPSEFAVLSAYLGSVAMIPNGIDLAEIDALVSADRANESQRDDRFTIAICGSINEARNPWLVREIIAASPRTWRWQWIGDGHLRPVVESNGNLEILGWLDRRDALKRLAQADVVLHASAWDGMPNAVLEAMALGIPVVASRGEGNIDVVADGATGFLCERRDEFVGALEYLETAPERRINLSKAARQRVEREFEIGLVMQRWSTLYGQVLGSS